MTKQCTKCFEVKSKEDFAKRTKNEKESLQSHCKSCNKEYRLSRKDKEKEYRKGYRERFKKKNPTYSKNKNLMYSYGITFDEYQDLILQQKGTCAICNLQTDLLVVDHDHSCCPGPKSCSKCIRGLLCRTCNLGLGYFKDNNQYMKNAVNYLQQFSNKNN